MHGTSIPCEKQNVLRMRGDQLQRRALLARTLVRTTIARYQLNNHIVDPRSLKFKKNINGKPEVDWQNDDGWCPPTLRFNISHTSSLIACGVTLNLPIGIDVEEKQRKAEKQCDSFCLEEAYVKAFGKGFSAAPFKTFTICVNNATKGTVGHADGLDYEPFVWKKTKHVKSGLGRVTVRKTIPFVEDEHVSGIDAVVSIAALIKQL